MRTWAELCIGKGREAPEPVPLTCHPEITSTILIGNYGRTDPTALHYTKDHLFFRRRGPREPFEGV